MKKLLVLISVILALMCTYCADRQDNEEKPPNFVIMFADDLGYGDLACYGNDVIRTPNLDKMAESGIRFSEFYSANPICSPSRAALLTGRYPVRMGINQVFFPESWTGMSPDEITLAEALKPLGYKSGVFGKWHLGHHRQFLPLQQGFDAYFGIPYSNDMAGVVYLEDNNVVNENVDQRLTTKIYTEKAIRFIEENKDQPFFVYIPYSMPHVPIYASGNFEGNSERGLYGDVIEEIDWSVGQVLTRLGELGLEENTVVFFSSDNGPWLVFGPEGGTAGPLREGKQYTFEGGMRVPGILQWKGKIQGGRQYDELVTTMDIFPTFLTLAGGVIPQDREIDGSDISSILLENKTLRDRELAFYMFGEFRAFRKGDWKIKMPYVGHTGSRGRKAVAAHDTLLFNLKEDIGELNNQIESEPLKKMELLEAMETFRSSMGELPPELIVRKPSDKSHYTKQAEWLKNK